MCSCQSSLNSAQCVCSRFNQQKHGYCTLYCYFTRVKGHLVLMLYDLRFKSLMDHARDFTVSWYYFAMHLIVVLHCFLMFFGFICNLALSLFSGWLEQFWYLFIFISFYLQFSLEFIFRLVAEMLIFNLFIFISLYFAI